MGGGEVEGSKAMNMQQLHEGRKWGDGLITVAPDGDVGM
jgi:hypothetical protein